MRQGQQNRRGRGRNNNNNNQGRKGQNPLTRSFESTGPDIKIRGTPAHIAEKYMALARDAQSSGDPVLAENYLQHAEHYNRIIMTYREQQMQQSGGEMQNGAARPRPAGFGEGGFGEDDDEGDFTPDQPQPFAQQPREGREDRGHRGGHEGGGRPFQGRDRGERGERFQRDRGDRSDRPERGDRPERIERAERPDRAPQPDIGIEGGQAPRRDRQPVPHHEQPEFLRRPVRRRRETPAEEAQPTPAPAVEGSGE